MENVCGALTSHGGRDFAAICATFAQAGYRLGPLIIDAALFRPQSRPRLFLIGVRGSVPHPLTMPGPQGPFHPTNLVRAAQRLPAEGRAGLLWWRLPIPAARNTALIDLLEDPSPAWDRPAATARLLSLMVPAHLARIAAAQRSGVRQAATVCRRMRPGPGGRPVQRAEARFDGLAGCLRTPAGGSSRQFVLEVEGDLVRSRLLSARESARLMGLADDYILPRTHNAALHLTGDGVVVDVVRHLAAHLLEPLLAPEARAAA
jgi:DNA (cytosine-5)-methyltransferase 1